jgi:hypothetical protein
MTDFYDVPVVATGDWIDAAFINQYWGDNFRALHQGFAAGGDMAYALDANTIAAVAKPASAGLLQNTSTGVPSWVTGGSAGYVVRKNAAGTGFELSAALPYCVVSHSTDFSYSTGAMVAWNTDALDPGGWHNNSTNTSRITVPETGIYIAGATLSYYETSGGAAGPRIITLLKNGVDVMSFRFTGYTDGVPRSLIIPHMPISLTANDYLEVSANLGGTRTVLAAESRFWVMRIG